MKIYAGKPINFVLLIFAFFLMTPSLGLCQTIYGDPSLTLFGISRGKIEVGGSVVKDQKIKIEDTQARVTTSTQHFTLDIPEATEEMESEQVFMTAAWNIGKVGDVFARIGQYRINEPFDGDYSISGGGGVRISPPHDGIVKLGILLQASYSSSEDSNIPFSISATGMPANGSQDFVNAYGSGKEKITIMRYDALLGFGIDKIPYFRPYAGMLFTIINGTDEGSFSGEGFECVVPPGGNTCTNQPSQVSLSFERDFSSDTSIGGIAGIVLNPMQDIGMTIEGQFGPHKSFGASAFVRF